MTSLPFTLTLVLPGHRDATPVQTDAVHTQDTVLGDVCTQETVVEQRVFGGGVVVKEGEREREGGRDADLDDMDVGASFSQTQHTQEDGDIADDDIELEATHSVYEGSTADRVQQEGPGGQVSILKDTLASQFAEVEQSVRKALGAKDASEDGPAETCEEALDRVSLATDRIILATDRISLATDRISLAQREEAARIIGQASKYITTMINKASRARRGI
ncbi:hypothetical protein KIPB_001142 [Kipferlia bialata]|uniref:Uncharacterized protein n=1 Tax=Kipferlia bialata TaxID=797122 RepID=A0A9K3CNC7_9EUKA|nr:hypothetical protein KIPB_001142 [Kipferlia bialata]|eukprot:g1142.t1